MSDIRVIDLSKAPGERGSWDRSAWLIYLWAACELLFITNPWQISSILRVWVLRAFGAQIGDHVVFRPRTRVKFPWKLSIGDRCWIGEGVWVHNQDQVSIGNDVVVSQETMITTGSHDVSRDMRLLTRPVVVEDGAWVTSRCMILGGARIRQSAVIVPLTVVRGEVPAGIVWGADGPIKERFR